MNKIIYIVMKSDGRGGDFPWAAFDSREKAIAEVKRLYPEPDYELDDFSINSMITDMVLE